MEKISESNYTNILSRIKQLYDQTIDYIYSSLTNIQSFLIDTIEKNKNINNIYNNNKIDECQISINKILNIIKQRYSNELKDNSNNNKILYKSKLINFYLKELFKDGNEGDEFFFPFYLLSYIMIVINHHEICLVEFFNGKIKINEFKSEDIDKNYISVVLRCFIFIEMFSLYFQLKCSINKNIIITKKNKEADLILNFYNTLKGNNYMGTKIINSLNEEEKKNVKNLSILSYKVILIFLYDFDNENKNNNNNGNGRTISNNSENILNQLINFSLLSYKDGLKTLIKECKLKKEIKIKIIKYKNYEYNNETLNSLFGEIKDQYPNKSILSMDKIVDDNINEIKNDNEIINSNYFKEIINTQNNKILSLTNELNDLKNEFNEYKSKMDNIVNSLEKKLNELTKNSNNNKNCKEP